MILTVVGGLSLSAAMAAQRTAVPAPTHRPAQQGPQIPALDVPIAGRGSTVQLDDEPDFAPMQTVRDGEGNEVGTRLVGNPYVLSFVGGDFTPAPGVDPTLVAAVRANPRGHTFAYVMIEGRLNDPLKIDRLRALGLDVLGTHTWQCAVVRVPLARVEQVAALPFVRWVGYAKPHQKLGLGLVARLGGVGLEGEKLVVAISTFASDVGPNTIRTIGAIAGGTPRAEVGAIERVIPNGPFQRRLEAAGFEFEHYTDVDNVHIFRGRATPVQIRALRELDFVAAIELVERHQGAHDQSQAMISADRVRKSYGGHRITVGVIDSGIDSTPWHKDFSGKSFVGWTTVGGSQPSPFEDEHGHGTHVSGTVFGRGLATARYTGTAPMVGNAGDGYRVFIGRYLNKNNKGEGDVGDLFKALSKSYTSKANKYNPRPRVINNSWGSSSSNLYKGTESRSREVDGYVWSKNQLHVFASGNSGKGCGSPGCAKNALTVGSVEDYKDTAKGIRPGDTSDFSRSGTADGRRKPEVSAPGRWVSSARKDTTSSYSRFMGTSMATPHVTGALAGLIDHYSWLDYKPASLKAVACATAEFQGRPVYDSRQGFGLINAYKMHWGGTRTRYWHVSGSISKSGNWVYADIDIPSNIVATKMVLAWSEPAAGSLASKARKSDVRLYVDVPGYSSKGNVGEYSVSHSVSNVIYGTSYATSSGNIAYKMRGKKVRFKVYGQSIAALSSVKFGLVIVGYMKHPYNPYPALTSTLSSTIVKPNATLTQTAKLSAHASGDELDNGHIYPSSTSKFKVTKLEATTADGIPMAFTSSSNAVNPFPYLTVGQGVSRTLKWTLKAPATNGEYWHWIFANVDPLNKSFTSEVKKICVDGSRPSNIQGLFSSTHFVNSWSSKKLITFKWTQAKDVGCAGISGLAYRLTKSGPSTPNVKNLAGNPTTRSFNLAETTGATGYYFNLRAVDKAGNWSSTNKWVGPYKIDTGSPIVQAVSINNGATSAKSLSATVKLTATDLRSGVFQMRFSSNNSTWSVWQAYANIKAYNLASFGGNAAEGTKRVYVQVRDRAGNVSASKSDTIYYRRAPVLAAAVTKIQANVTSGYFRFTGTDLSDVHTVWFGGQKLSTQNADNWHRGYFRKLGDSVIHVYPPQGLVANSYAVQVENIVAKSNALPVSVIYPATRRLRTHTTLTAGSPQTVFTHRGNLAGAVVSYLAISSSKVPSVLPGVVSFGIGNGFTDLTLLPIPFAHDAVTGAAKIGPFPTNPGMKGSTLHFQTVTVKLPLAMPLTTTNVWSTTYQ